MPFRPLLTILILINVLPAQVKALICDHNFTGISPVGDSAFFTVTLRPSQRSSLVFTVVQWCRECYRSLSRLSKVWLHSNSSDMFAVFSSFLAMQARMELTTTPLQSSSIYGWLKNAKHIHISQSHGYYSE